MTPVAVLLGGALAAACSDAGESSVSGVEPLSSCAFSITQNVYDGPNYWGTITIKNDEPSSVTGFSVQFTIPSGDHCTNDAVPPGATLGPLTGSGTSATTRSNVCVFRWAHTTLAAGASLTFNYSTDNTNFEAASNVSVASSSCGVASGSGSGSSSGAVSDAGGATLCPMLQPTTGPTSKWAHVDVPGHLAYGTLPTGERLLDFSTAGYMGGGVPIPQAPVKQTLHPSGGANDAPAIQAAIDAVSALSPSGGIRGAVLLAPGTFHLEGPLKITTSGVVLRGSGPGAQGTLVELGGTPFVVLTIAGSGSFTEGTPTAITDDYVPSGAASFHVASTASLKVGAPVIVNRPVTAAWVHFMGMDTLVRNGMPQTWIAPGSMIRAERTVAAIAGNVVTLDAPLSDTYDLSTWGSGAPRPSVAPYSFAGRIQQVGLESMHLVAPAQSVPINQPTFGLLEMNAVENAWVKDVVGDEFTGGFGIGGTAKSVTIEDTQIGRTAPIDGSAGYPAWFSIDGEGTLVQRCSVTGNNVFPYVTQAETPGPNVVLDLKANGLSNNLMPHQRWATGLLIDRTEVPTGGIELMNRGTAGSGQGWAIGFGAIWNSATGTLVIQQPPGAMNWAIGSSGTLKTQAAPGGSTILPQGIVDSHDVLVAPSSLYLAQLCERLGPNALTATGY